MGDGAHVPCYHVEVTGQLLGVEFASYAMWVLVIARLGDRGLYCCPPTRPSHQQEVFSKSDADINIYHFGLDSENVFANYLPVFRILLIHATRNHYSKKISEKQLYMSFLIYGI